MTAAIHFHPEGYSTQGPKLMGRHAAGESFLKGWLLHSRSDTLYACIERPEYGQAFSNLARSLCSHRQVRLIPHTQPAALTQAGTLYLPGPSLADSAWQRACFGSTAWSLSGITHTTSSASAMDGLVGALTSPTMPWDAVICTSQAVRSNVQALWHLQEEFLRDRLGAQHTVRPQTPVIPLGIHTADFAFNSIEKAASRQQLGIPPDAVVVLYMGRLSFHAKAHPLAMYQALEATALRSGLPMVLVECGWHANDAIATAYTQAHREACPTVRVITLDGREALQRRQAWSSADVFCSLSDNIQESFGLAPIEAMAAGLPVVVSDWDGYRDSVRHGVDGFSVPSHQPSPGLGADIAARHALGVDSYDQYIGHASSFVSIDVEAATQALLALATQPALRRRMGAQAQERVRMTHDWSAIIPRYEALWAELDRLRTAAATSGRQARGLGWPARTDPFTLYASYPTQVITPDTRVCRVDPDIDRALDRLQRYRRLSMVSFSKAVLPPHEEQDLLLSLCPVQPATVASVLTSARSNSQAAHWLRTLVWMAKLHLVAFQKNA